MISTVAFCAACNAQAASAGLDYQHLIACTVAVEDHYLWLSAASIKVHDGNLTAIEHQEVDERKKWLTLVGTSGQSTGKSPDEIESDLIAERKTWMSSGDKAEWDRLDELYTKSDPTLKLMPYYRPLTAKARDEVKARRDGITEVAHQKSAELYRRCSTELR